MLRAGPYLQMTGGFRRFISMPRLSAPTVTGGNTQSSRNPGRKENRS